MIGAARACLALATIAIGTGQPGVAQTWLARAPENGRHLVVLDNLRGALDWGPAQRGRRVDGAVSAERTLGTTIRRVGTEGRLDETSAA